MKNNKYYLFIWILILIALLSSCNNIINPKTNIETESSIPETKTDKQSNIDDLTFFESWLAAQNYALSNRYSKSIYTEEKMNDIFSFIINEDLWYNGKNSIFYNFIGKEISYIYGMEFSNYSGFQILFSNINDSLKNSEEEILYTILSFDFIELSNNINWKIEADGVSKGLLYDFSKSFDLTLQKSSVVKVDAPQKPSYIKLSTFMQTQLNYFKDNITSIMSDQNKFNFPDWKNIYVEYFFNNKESMVNDLRLSFNFFVETEKEIVYLKYSYDMFYDVENEEYRFNYEVIEKLDKNNKLWDKYEKVKNYNLLTIKS